MEQEWNAKIREDYIIETESKVRNTRIKCSKYYIL